MINNSHLVLHEASVPAATEWSVNLQGWLFLRVLRGEACAFRGKTPLLLSEGDALINAPGRSCQLRASQLGEIRVQYFQVVPDLLVGVLSSSERKQLETAPQHVHDFPRHLLAANPFVQQFAAFDKRASAGHTLLARCEMLHLSALMLTEHLSPASPPNHVLTAKHRFAALVTQMVDGEFQRQTPEELARQCGCSVRHFSRLFRNYFGHSLVPTRIESNLHKAKGLLEDSSAKIIDVAMDSGFNHVGLFTSRFKKRFGYTPSEWRKRRSQPAKTNGEHKGRIAARSVGRQVA